MKNSLQNYFYYSRSERNGALVLVFLSLILFVLPHFFPYFLKSEPPDFSAFAADVAELEEKLNEKENASNGAPHQRATLIDFDPNLASKDELQRLGLPEKTVQTIINYRSKGGKFSKISDLKKIYTLTEEDYTRLKPYIHIGVEGKHTKSILPVPKAEVAEIRFQPFDPNTASHSALIALGLSEKLANTIVNYRKKGGAFRKKEDLQRIYGLTAKQYRQLQSYIQLKDSLQVNNKSKEKYPFAAGAQSYDQASEKIDINLAGDEEWQKLRGIGPVFAKRILRFREKLGGFHTLRQIGDTYGLPDSTYQQIRPFLVYSPIFRHININQNSPKELSAHPYITWKEAGVLVNYRNEHGPYKNVEELKKIKVLTAEKLEKIAPYLKF